MTGMYSVDNNKPTQKKETLPSSLNDNTELKIVIQKMNAMNADLSRLKQDVQRYKHIINELQLKIQKVSTPRPSNDWDY